MPRMDQVCGRGPNKRMTEQDIALRVRQIVSEVFSLPVEILTPESSPTTIEGWDSVGQLNLIIALEQEFHVQFSPDDVEKMVDVQGVVGALRGLGMGKEGGDGWLGGDSAQRG